MLAIWLHALMAMKIRGSAIQDAYWMFRKEVEVKRSSEHAILHERRVRTSWRSQEDIRAGSRREEDTVRRRSSRKVVQAVFQIDVVHAIPV